MQAVPRDLYESAALDGASAVRRFFSITIPSIRPTIIFVVITAIGIARHGTHFFSLFFPHGAPLATAPILIPIEVVSYLSRPVSLSVRLFANILAGHITLAVFGGFVVLLLASKGWAFLAPVPLLAIVALYALELLVACLQAFVFSVLTCVYLNDAIHPGH